VEHLIKVLSNLQGHPEESSARCAPPYITNHLKGGWRAFVANVSNATQLVDPEIDCVDTCTTLIATEDPGTLPKTFKVQKENNQ
jgi:hypothetical protein